MHLNITELDRKNSQLTLWITKLMSGLPLDCTQLVIDINETSKDTCVQPFKIV